VYNVCDETPDQNIEEEDEEKHFRVIFFHSQSDIFSRFLSPLFVSTFNFVTWCHRKVSNLEEIILLNALIV